MKLSDTIKKVKFNTQNPNFGKSQQFWDRVEEAAKEVATWPRWKIRAADRALVTKMDYSLVE